MAAHPPPGPCTMNARPPNDSMSTDIEIENLFQNFNGDVVKSPDSARDEDLSQPLTEIVPEKDLPRVVAEDTNRPSSASSADSELAIIQHRLIEIADDLTSLDSPDSWSSARSNENTPSHTSTQDQERRNLDLMVPMDKDNDIPPSRGFNVSGKSHGQVSITERDENPRDLVLSPPQTRKRPRTSANAGASTSGIPESKLRKITPSPDSTGSSPPTNPDKIDIRQIFALSGSDDDFAEIEREQQEAEKWLRRKREQEREDEEYARKLQQMWNESPNPSRFDSPSSSTSQLGSTLIHSPFGSTAIGGNLSRDGTSADKSVFSKAGFLPVHENKPAQSSKLNNDYVEISSDSDIEEILPGSNHIHAGRSTPYNRIQQPTRTSARGLWPKPITREATSFNFSTSCNKPKTQGEGLGYPSLDNLMGLPNSFLFGKSPYDLLPNSRLNGYDARNHTPSSRLNGYSNSYNDDCALNDEIANLISRTAWEFETSGMSVSNMNSRLYDQITPKTTMDELKKLLENIRPDQDLDINREGTPAALQCTLMEHQKLGLTWMKSMEEGSNKGGILADDMGLGKTIQALALMVSRPSERPEWKTNLIIAPVALVQQWKREIERMIKPRHQLKVFVLHNGKRNVPYSTLKTYDVVLTTYGTLAAEFKRKEFADRIKIDNPHTYQNLPDDAINLPLLGEESKWYRVILDEAQCIKNKDTKSARACSQLHSIYRWCMSGTPMMNNVLELFSLIKFLRIKPYHNIETFNTIFARPLKSGVEHLQNRAMEKLQALLKAILLRRTKRSKIDGKQILQLPPRTTEKTYAVFSEDEQALYRALESQTQLQFNRYLRANTVGRNYSNVLVLLLRLRQACCHPHLMTDFGIDFNGPDTEGIDMVANAKEFPPNVVARLKENETSECPVCIDVVENAVIFFPCGHSTCAECFARISDPSQRLMQGDEGSLIIKCPSCRGMVNTKKVTDYISFKKVFYSEPEEAAVEDGQDAEDAEADTDSLADFLADDDADDSNPPPGKPKDHKQDRKGKGKAIEKARKSLPQLKKDATKSAEGKREYLRHLTENWETSAKIEKTMEILHDIQSRIPTGDDKPEKTIIFSQFTSLLDLLEVPILRKGWGYRRYDGSMNPNQRNEAVMKFTDSKDCTIMLVSLKAGNAGLNLVAASQVIIFDPFWNPYIEEQAIDRAHRIGQVRPVVVHRILVKNTVEDRILDLQEKKRTLIEGALDEGASQRIGRLGTRELAFLFVGFFSSVFLMLSPWAGF
ncbi:DNA repair protein RAD16 [Paracoccidioides lutzii Pb01]|uniref:DNA repair protein RAD16 n=1 Tax=Paracoccidioides lutzii (strain ATCC MYA-826 / Pb01) TaxID=502779 RepID=C1H1K8_PARBA|nr:DNA repair protein RAD16 [Paracoccidioides lutzii Pb01]EEH33602.2 DNA repair protein RAD16 [Paracoccidioides lutzii Pb01]